MSPESQIYIKPEAALIQISNTEKSDNNSFTTNSSKQISQLRKQYPEAKSAPRIEIPSKSEFGYGDTKIHFHIKKELNGTRTGEYGEAIKIIKKLQKNSELINAGVVFLFDQQNADTEYMFDINSQTIKIEIAYTNENLSQESKNRITTIINKLLKQEESKKPCLFGCGM